MDLINLVESKYIKTELTNKTIIEIGDLIRVGYKIPEGDKERTQFYEGVIIAKQNKGLRQTFTLRRIVQGAGQSGDLLHSHHALTLEVGFVRHQHYLGKWG